MASGTGDGLITALDEPCTVIRAVRACVVQRISLTPRGAGPDNYGHRCKNRLSTARDTIG